ncbi:REG4 protein, partial [Rhynochetos jubatus]|nr:REG4 protein [Rhynochetos jubatus]
PSTGARYIDYCPKGWSYYKLSCCKYFRQLRSWDEAERQCQASHADAHLAWVEEPQEAATLKKVISYYQRGVGGQQDHASDPFSLRSQTWQWVNGDEYSTSSGLAGNSAHGGACGMLTHLSGFTLWSSAECTRQHHYICKFTP